MSLIVQKFGGSSVANAERIFHVAKTVTDTYRNHNDVVVVVSAQGDTTDDLLEKAAEINQNLPNGKWTCFFPLESKFPSRFLLWQLKN